MTPNCNIITIDGPAGSGKSTISRAIADKLGYVYLDTGAMYRAVGLQVSLSKVDLNDEQQMKTVFEELDLQILPGEGEAKVILNQEDVSRQIRSPEMGMMASKVSALPIVREKLTDIQRKLGSQGSIVAEGRDMGTVVFPEAQNKFFLDAAPEERARRRTLQLEEKDMPADYEEILQQIKKRDHNDRTRALAPLIAAQDATIIDSSTMTIVEVIDFIADTVNR